MSLTTSGWLFKLSTTNKLGASKWQSRYFVLLDTELRYYRDEHAVSSSSTINLCDVSKITRTSFFNHNYCFKLETTEGYQKQFKRPKTWTMECHSEYELDMWLAAINQRLLKKAPLPRKTRNRTTVSRRRGLVLPQLEIDTVPALDSPSSSNSSYHSPPPPPYTLENHQPKINSQMVSLENNYLFK
ncbi:hypothetical protein BY458DRAFT_270258 [Sporodiniella umbellata]|nr:hypothetical protein BY458DRAFT_270258 [Sporodiniella umbellata]